MMTFYIRYTIGKQLTRMPYARGKRVPPGVLACLDYTMASIKAVDHADPKPAPTFPGRGVCGKQAAVYTS